MLTSALIDGVADIPLLDAYEAASLASSVMRLRPHWVMRNLYAPFYTLGTASYLDATGPAPKYAAWASEFNPILRENFSWLYSRLLETIQDALGEPAIYAPHLALPGFHIYLSSPLFEKPVASVHCDSQYSLHRWPSEAELEQPLSFTLSVQLPQHGGGLYVWDLLASSIQGQTDADVAKMMRDTEREFHPYHVGSIALHSGNLLHQAAPGSQLGPEDRRITLQGHGVRVNGVWQLYW